MGAVALVAALGFAVGLAAAPATVPLPELGQAAQFSIPAVSGGRLDLAELRSHGPVVIDFWATWCKPCVMALPELGRIHERFGERGLSVIGISVDGPRNHAKVRPFAAKMGLGFPIAIDADESLQQLYQVKAFPTTFLVAPDGRIAWYRQGYLPGDAEALERAIVALLDTASVRTEP